MAIANITNVTSTKPNGEYSAGDIIDIQVEFDQDVTVTGTPQLNLDVKSGGRLVDYDPYGSAFILRVKTDNIGVSNNDQFRIPLKSGETYDFTVDYDGQVTTHNTDTDLTLTFPSGAGTYDIYIYGTFPCIKHNGGSIDEYKVLEVKNWGGSVWTDMENAFYGCLNMDVTATDTPNVQNVSNFRAMFRLCQAMTSINISSWDMSSATDCQQMFYECTELLTANISNSTTSSVTTFAQFFYKCQKLATATLTNLNTSSAITLSEFFFQCQLLSSIDISNWNTALCQNFSSLFNACNAATTINVSGINTSSATTMYKMFSGCLLVTSLDVISFNTALVQDFGEMFIAVSSVTSLNVTSFDTSNATNMFAMFYGMTALTTLDVSGFYAPLCTNMSLMFFNLPNITSLNVLSLDCGSCTTMDSMFKNLNTSCTLTGPDSFDITSLTTAVNMFENYNMGTTLYDALLVAWEGQTENTSVTFHGGNAKYSAGAPATARGVLTGTSLWTITDGGPV